MKKSLLALAVLGAFATAASAQSSVTLSGIVKQGVAFGKTSPVTTAGNKGSSTALVDGSSRFIIGGSEDLGGGLRANFQIDNRFRPDEGAGTLAGGNTFVGLSGGFGAVQLGRLDTHYCQNGDAHAASATSLQASNCGIMGFVRGSGAGGNADLSAIANTSRITNAIRYTSPDMSGLRGSLTYSTAPFGSENAPGASREDGQAVALTLTYTAGPIRAGFSYWDAEAEAVANTGQNAYTLWGGYNFGFVNVGLTYDQSERENAGVETKRTAFSIPVTAPIGAGTLIFAYSQAQDAKVRGAKEANSGATLWSLGYNYPLSKRTSVGVSYAKMSNDRFANYGLYTGAGLGNLNTPVNGQDQEQFLVGVRHAF